MIWFRPFYPLDVQMLTSFRKSAGSWFTKIFLFILVVSFGIWGVADFVNSAKEAPLAKVA
ncbi:MAG: hypothetical protein EXR08_00005, partial [Alphaproteobacteria bacterium]|nr:hypothetical protein [Alphaproteobacteria bacterium]